MENKAHLVWTDGEYRIIRRRVAYRTEKAIFDIEHRTKDALGNDAWHQVECVSERDKAQEMLTATDLFVKLLIEVDNGKVLARPLTAG